MRDMAMGCYKIYPLGGKGSTTQPLQCLTVTTMVNTGGLNHQVLAWSWDEAGEVPFVHNTRECKQANNDVPSADPGSQHLQMI